MGGWGAVQLGYHNFSLPDEGRGLCLIKRKDRLHKAQRLKSLVLLRKCLVTSAVFHSSSMILFVVLSVLVIFFQENPIDMEPLLLRLSLFSQML